MVATAVKVQQVKDQLSHPIIDNDGHMIEFLPYVIDILEDVAGAGIAKTYSDYMAPTDRGDSAETRRARRMPRGSFWPFPAANSLDRATGMLPGLLYERMPEIGIDFSVILPSCGLDAVMFEDEELRRATSRAFNIYFSSILSDFSSRMTPAALIPAFTPEEAIAELEYAVNELGVRAAMVGHTVWRTTKTASGEVIRWVD